jgi:hypothetical protein
MNEESVPENIGFGVAPVQSVEMAPGPSEFDLGYYGWRVVLAVSA